MDVSNTNSINQFRLESSMYKNENLDFAENRRSENDFKIVTPQALNEEALLHLRERYRVFWKNCRDAEANKNYNCVIDYSLKFIRELENVYNLSRNINCNKVRSICRHCIEDLLLYIGKLNLNKKLFEKRNWINMLVISLHLYLRLLETKEEIKLNKDLSSEKLISYTRDYVFNYLKKLLIRLVNFYGNDRIKILSILIQIQQNNLDFLQGQILAGLIRTNLQNSEQFFPITSKDYIIIVLSYKKLIPLQTISTSKKAEQELCKNFPDNIVPRKIKNFFEKYYSWIRKDYSKALCALDSEKHSEIKIYSNYEEFENERQCIPSNVYNLKYIESKINESTKKRKIAGLLQNGSMIHENLMKRQRKSLYEINDNKCSLRSNFRTQSNLNSSASSELLFNHSTNNYDSSDDVSVVEDLSEVIDLCDSDSDDVVIAPNYSRVTYKKQELEEATVISKDEAPCIQNEEISVFDVNTSQMSKHFSDSKNSPKVIEHSELGSSKVQKNKALQNLIVEAYGKSNKTKNKKSNTLLKVSKNQQNEKKENKLNKKFVKNIYPTKSDKIEKIITKGVQNDRTENVDFTNECTQIILFKSPIIGDNKIIEVNEDSQLSGTKCSFISYLNCKSELPSNIEKLSLHESINYNPLMKIVEAISIQTGNSQNNNNLSILPKDCSINNNEKTTPEVKEDMLSKESVANFSKTPLNMNETEIKFSTQTLNGEDIFNNVEGINMPNSSHNDENTSTCPKEHTFFSETDISVTVEEYILKNNKIDSSSDGKENYLNTKENNFTNDANCRTDESSDLLDILNDFSHEEVVGDEEVGDVNDLVAGRMLEIEISTDSSSLIKINNFGTPIEISESQNRHSCPEVDNRGEQIVNNNKILNMSEEYFDYPNFKKANYSQPSINSHLECNKKKKKKYTQFASIVKNNDDSKIKTRKTYNLDYNPRKMETSNLDEQSTKLIHNPLYSKYCSDISSDEGDDDNKSKKSDDESLLNLNLFDTRCSYEPSTIEGLDETYANFTEDNIYSHDPTQKSITVTNNSDNTNSVSDNGDNTKKNERNTRDPVLTCTTFYADS